MLIEEIGEKNFEDAVNEGSRRVFVKLEKWHRQEKNKQMNLYSLLDPTIWAYNNLRDKQNNPLKLQGFQDKFISDMNRIVICVAANQIGKSWCVCIKALHHALHIDNASVLIVSRSEQQSIMLLDEIKWMMRRSNRKFESVIDNVENRTELHITNIDGKGVSVIRCLPCTESVLSYPATLLICDEIAFWEIDGSTQSKYFNRVIVSRTNNTKNWKAMCSGDDVSKYFKMGQIVCISNPNGQRGILWDLWNDPDVHQYRYCWLANKDNTLAEYMKLKEKLSSDEFESVYAAEFTSASGGFITQEEYNNAVKEYDMGIPMDSVYLGADFAGDDTVSRDTDDSVMYGGVKLNENNMVKTKIVYMKEFPKKIAKSHTVFPELEWLHKNYSLGGLGYDRAGVSDSIKNNLVERGVLPDYMIETFTYSLPNKSEIYSNMKRMFEQRRVILPHIPKLKEQLLGLRFEKTDGGHIKVHHARENMHDDHADALANCIWMVTRFGGGIGVEVVEQKRGGKTPKGVPRKAVLCSVCGNNAYSSEPEKGMCDRCL